MSVIGIYNLKGGVGKTATAVNLAYLAAQDDQTALLWDLDPQGAASYYFRIEPKVAGGGQRLLSDGGKQGDLSAAIKGTDFSRLDLLPADFSLRHLDLLIADAKGVTKRLGKRLRPFRAEYDTVLLDCPPGLSLVSESVFRAVDALLVPVIPTTLSARTLEQMFAFFAGDKRLRDLPVIPFFSMVDRRKALHRELLDALPRRWPRFLQTAIPYASDVERMGLQRSPLPVYAPRSSATCAYRALWSEVQDQLS